MAFVGGAAAIDIWESENVQQQVKEKSEYISEFLTKEIASLNSKIEIRGIGMIWGADLSKLEDEEVTDKILKRCFDAGLIIESAGRKGQVVKLLPSLTIPMELLKEGCEIVKQAFTAELG